MEQIKKNDGENARIKFVIPDEGPTDQVAPGTVYTAQKFDGQKWVDVGETKVTGTNLRGSTTEMPITGDVADGDLIRIKSKEPGKLESYSVGDANSGAYTPQVQDPSTPDTPPADTGHYVKLDLVGPEANGKAEDERFRRYINIDATLDEVPGKEVTIEVGTKGEQGAEGNETFTGNRDQVIKFYNEIAHNEDITLHGVWMTATDKFGNKKTTKLTYKQTYQLDVRITGLRSGRNYLRLRSEKAGTSVKLTFLKNGKEVRHTQTVKIDKANKLQKIDLGEYKMEKGTDLMIEGSFVEGTGKDAKVYPNNPWIQEIR